MPAGPVEHGLLRGRGRALAGLHRPVRAEHGPVIEPGDRGGAVPAHRLAAAITTSSSPPSSTIRPGRPGPAARKPARRSPSRSSSWPARARLLRPSTPRWRWARTSSSRPASTTSTSRSWSAVPDTVVLGLGFATLVPQHGNAAMVVVPNSGVKLSGLIIDAGPVNSPVLLSVGVPGAELRQRPGPHPGCLLPHRRRGDHAVSATVSLLDNAGELDHRRRVGLAR